MKVLILNSGIGSRLKPYSEGIPKCLLDLKGKSILQRQIEALLLNGLEKFIITTGPYEDKLIKHVKDLFPNLDVEFVNNEKFAETNYIYSIWLTREIIDDDILLLHGDLVFDETVLKKIISQNQNSVIIDKDAPLPEKDFKGLIKNGKIIEIGINIFGANAKFLLPLYYWKQNYFKIWIDEMKKLLDNGQMKVYAENAFNTIPQQLPLFPVYLDGAFCMEIDTYEDYLIALKKI
jgi:choline kinase